MRKFKEMVRAYLYKPEVLLAEQFMYGHREIYIKEFGFTTDTYFRGLLQHGWTRNPGYLSELIHGRRSIRNRSFKSYPSLVWSETLAKRASERFGLEVYAITSPWALVSTRRHVELLENQDTRSTGSVLYFPAHTYPGVSVNIWNEKAVDRLKQLGANSITTCLYWTDFLNPIIRKKYEEFSQIDCCGYKGSAATESPWTDLGGRVTFLEKLFDLIETHELIVCDEVSTAFAAACTLRKKVMLSSDGFEVKPSGFHGATKLSIETATKSMLEFDLSKPLKTFEVLDSTGSLCEVAREGFGFDLDYDLSRRTLRALSSKSREQGINQGV